MKKSSKENFSGKSFKSDKVWNRVFPFKVGDRVGFYSISPKGNEEPVFHKGILRLKLSDSFQGCWRVEIKSDKYYGISCFVHVFESRLIRLEGEKDEK